MNKKELLNKMISAVENNNYPYARGILDTLESLQAEDQRTKTVITTVTNKVKAKPKKYSPRQELTRVLNIVKEYINGNPQSFAKIVAMLESRGIEVVEGSLRTRMIRDEECLLHHGIWSYAPTEAPWRLPSTKPTK